MPMSCWETEQRPGSSDSRTIGHDPSVSFAYREYSTSTTSVKNRKSEDPERGEGETSHSSLWTHLATDVDPARCTGLLVSLCFMTGYIAAIGFSAMFIWCGPQTGNTIQLAFSLARLFEGPPAFRDLTFQKSDQQALCSIISFNLGVFLAARIGDKVGGVTRIWQIGSAIFQALFTMAAAIAIWKGGEPSIAISKDNLAWTNLLAFVGLAFMSLSLGIQGTQGKRLDTHFGNTIPLTTIWVELLSDPRLLKLRQRVPSRDYKVLAIISVFIGSFCGRALAAKIGASATLGIGAGFRALIAVSWLFVPRKTSTQ